MADNGLNSDGSRPAWMEHFDAGEQVTLMIEVEFEAFSVEDATEFLAMLGGLGASILTVEAE